MEFPSLPSMEYLAQPAIQTLPSDNLCRAPFSIAMGRLAPQQDGDPDTRPTTVHRSMASRRSPAPSDASIGEENPWCSSSFFIGRRQIGLLRVVQASDKFAICCHGILKNRARHSCFTSMHAARVQLGCLVVWCELALG
jgi:hypothetical protein